MNVAREVERIRSVKPASVLPVPEDFMVEYSNRTFIRIVDLMENRSAHGQAGSLRRHAHFLLSARMDGPKRYR
jgi:hypothetical protein